jgi:hypothetical protein
MSFEEHEDFVDVSYLPNKKLYIHEPSIFRVWVEGKNMQIQFPHAEHMVYNGRMLSVEEVLLIIKRQ